MKYLLAILLSAGFLNAQDFKTTTSTFVNGLSGPMEGVPGDVFTSTTKFTNLTGDSVNIAVSRYKNDLPPYWALCYCYIQCYSPADDNIVVGLAAYESVDVTLLFKTDSVNPGKAEAAFSIQQIGSSSVAHMTHTASTMPITVGITKSGSDFAQLRVYPNPASDNIKLIFADFQTGTGAIYSSTGELIRDNITLTATENTIETHQLSAGVYLFKISAAGREYQTLFVKQ